MSHDEMDIESAEQRLKSMEHSEQHYFNRYVETQTRTRTLVLGGMDANSWPAVITIMVRCLYHGLPALWSC
jgi:hypothetical protein